MGYVHLSAIWICLLPINMFNHATCLYKSVMFILVLYGYVRFAQTCLAMQPLYVRKGVKTMTFIVNGAYLNHIILKKIAKKFIRVLF